MLKQKPGKHKASPPIKPLKPPTYVVAFTVATAAVVFGMQTGTASSPKSPGTAASVTAKATGQKVMVTKAGKAPQQEKQAIKPTNKDTTVVQGSVEKSFIAQGKAAARNATKWPTLPLDIENTTVVSQVVASQPKPVVVSQRPKPSPAKWTLSVPGQKDSLYRGGQSEIDQCKAVVYYGTYPDEKPATPTLWIAGHDHCGYFVWRNLPIGTKVALISNQGETVVYQIDKRVYVPRQGGSSQGLVHSDLMLQTCKGQGTTITYAHKIA